MKLTTSELAYVRSQGLYITEKCDHCGKLLNQTVRYTIAGKPEVYCSARCRDLVFFGDSREAKKRSTPGKCVYCGATLEGKKRGSIFCDDVCRMRHSRVREGKGTRRVEESRTPTQSNQLLADAKNGSTGNRITGVPQLGCAGARGREA